VVGFHYVTVPETSFPGDHDIMTTMISLQCATLCGEGAPSQLPYNPAFRFSLSTLITSPILAILLLHVPIVPMAEQDHYNKYFGGKADQAPSASDMASKLPNASGAEQDVHGAHFSGDAPSAGNLASKLPKTSGAEQDIYGSHLSGKLPSISDITSKLPQASGAEQDVHGSHLSGKAPSLGDISSKVPQTSGAEQDVHGSHFSDKLPAMSSITNKLPKISSTEQATGEPTFGGSSEP
jgi:hypothetical protein